MSYFTFITDEVLRKNLDITLDHIVELLAISESNKYKTKILLVSSMRKTIIIHTASIIEALLLWELKQKIDNEELELSNEWKYFDIKTLHKLNTSEEVIAGKRKHETKNIDKLDFVRIIDLCKKYRIISDSLAKKAHKVRELRNRLHISGLTAKEKEYKKGDLNFVFDVAKRAKEVVASE